jgi:hypothetical protein
MSAVNILAAGRATIESQGRSYDVVEPEVIDAAAALQLLSSKRQRYFARLGIEHHLKVSDAP